MRKTSQGMGYRFSETNRTITSAGALNIVTRLASRTVTGHEITIHVHQHYGLEFHLVLDKHDGSKETCINRGKLDYVNTKQVSAQLERIAFMSFVHACMMICVSCPCHTKSSSVLEQIPYTSYMCYITILQILRMSLQ